MSEELLAIEINTIQLNINQTPSAGSAQKLLQYCQLPAQSFAILLGIFETFAVFQIFFHLFHDFSANLYVWEALV